MVVPSTVADGTDAFVSDIRVPAPSESSTRNATVPERPTEAESQTTPEYDAIPLELVINVERVALTRAASAVSAAFLTVSVSNVTATPAIPSPY